MYKITFIACLLTIYCASVQSMKKSFTDCTGKEYMDACEKIGKDIFPLQKEVKLSFYPPFIQNKIKELSTDYDNRLLS